MNVSVIIPVYNVEKYIERCILSIINQTYTEGVECIIIDDCTPDDSMKIVEKMVADYKGEILFKLLYHKSNQGIASTRNMGLCAASGKYIIYIDSYDYCELDMLEKMYSKAVEEDADIVVADHWCSFKDHEIYCLSCVPESRLERIKSLFGKSGFPDSLWLQLVRRKLFIDKNLKCVENINYREDLILVSFLLYYAEKIVHIPQAFYHYVKYNSNSSTFVARSRKLLEDHFLSEQVIFDFYRDKGMIKELHKEYIGYRIRNMQELLLYSEGTLQRKWYDYYSDINFIEFIKYRRFESSVNLYWKIACLFVPLRMLWVHNLMRKVWKTFRKKQIQHLSFYSK